MAREEVTLFIEDAGIRLLVARGRVVEKWASAPLEPGAVSGGVIVNEAVVVERLKELLKLEELKTTRVITALSEPNALYRLVTLPELPPAMLPEAVRREAERVIPLPLNEAYLSYQAIPTAAKETRVFLAAFSRSATDTLVRTLRQAGLVPYVMDLAPLALCRAVEEPRAVVVGLRGASLDIVVMVDRVPEVIRSLSVLPEVESLQERVASVAEELDRTIAFYNSTHEKTPLDLTVPVFVCGDLAEAPETWQLLVGGLKRPVSVLSSPVSPPEGFEPGKSMINIGLALKSLALEKEVGNFSLVNFNALPEAYRVPTGISLQRFVAPVGAGIGVGLLMFMGFLVQSSGSRTVVLRKQVAIMESAITQGKTDIAAATEQVKQLQVQLEPIVAKRDILQTTLADLSTGHEKSNGDLIEIMGRLPAGATLTAVSYVSEGVGLSGVAPEAQVLEYAAALRASGRFTSVTISSLSLSSVETDEEGTSTRLFSFQLSLK